METEIISQGVDLMLYGMGTVFAFLTVLVVSTTLMSTFIGRFFPEVVDTDHLQKPVPQTKNQPVTARTLSVIQDAIYQHRAKTK